MTEGQRLLALAIEKHSQEQIAAKCGVSRPLVAHWKSGFRKPTRDAPALLEVHFGIPRASWEQRAAARGALAAPPRVAPPPKRDELDDDEESDEVEGEPIRGAHALAVEHERAARRLLRDVDNGSIRERAAAMSAVKQAIQLLARVEPDEAKIIRSDAWRRISSILLAALEPYPDACEACVVALRKARELGRVGT